MDPIRLDLLGQTAKNNDFESRISTLEGYDTVQYNITLEDAGGNVTYNILSTDTRMKHIFNVDNSKDDPDTNDTYSHLFVNDFSTVVGHEVVFNVLWDPQPNPGATSGKYKNQIFYKHVTLTCAERDSDDYTYLAANSPVTLKGRACRFVQVPISSSGNRMVEVLSDP